jgi:hypothetical protein
VVHHLGELAWANTCFLEQALHGYHTYVAWSPPALFEGADTPIVTPVIGLHVSSPNWPPSFCCLRCKKGLNRKDPLVNCLGHCTFHFPDFSLSDVLHVVVLIFHHAVELIPHVVVLIPYVVVLVISTAWSLILYYSSILLWSSATILSSSSLVLWSLPFLWLGNCCMYVVWYELNAQG